MAIVSQGNSVVVDLGPTDAIWIKSTGNAAVLVNQTFAGTPDSFNVTTDVHRVGYYGEPVQVTIRAVTGQAEYQDQQFSIQPLTSTQMGGKADSSATDIALTVNGAYQLPAKQSQTVILFGDSFAESFSFPPAPHNGDQLSISMYRFVAGSFGNSIKVIRNAGVSGNTAAQMLSRYETDILPFRSDWVFFNVGVNDFFGLGYSADTVFAQVQQLLSLMLSEGRKVLMVNCPPQVTTRSNYSAARATQCALYNKLLADYVKTLNGVTMVDIYSQLVNWSDTTNAGALTQFFGSDGIHLSVLGTIQCANAINAALSTNVAANRSQPISPLDPGIGGTESVLVGTGGGNLAGSSGTVATGWASQRASGTNGTIVASKIAPVGQRQTITLIATNGDSRFRLSCDTDAEFAAHLGKTVTTTIRGRCRTLSGGAHLKELVLKLYLFDGSTITNATNGNAYSGYSPLADSSFDTGEFLVTLRDIQIPSPLSDSGVFIELLMNSVAGGVVELDIYGVEIRESI